MLLFIQNKDQFALGAAIAKINKWPVGTVNWQQFSDGEWYLVVKEKVRDKPVWILGAINPPADNLVKLLILINALRVNGARKINLILPYFGYERQDRLDQIGAPVSLQVMSQVLKTAGVNQIFSLDIHSPEGQKIVGKALKNLDTIALLAQPFLKFKGKFVIAAPDSGAIERAKKLAKIMGTGWVWLEKVRPTQQTAKIVKLHGKVKGFGIIIIDDLIETGGTILAAATTLKRSGAGQIYVAATHGILAKDASKKLQKGPFEKIYITNSLDIAISKKFPKLYVLDASKLIARHLN